MELKLLVIFFNESLFTNYLVLIGRVDTFEACRYLGLFAVISMHRGYCKSLPISSELMCTKR